MRLPRSSGILLHPTSLPGPHGIGDLGDAAHAFLGFLAAAGQRVWQILPLGPVGPGGSPYQGSSAFAGNPLLISLDMLAADGLLDGDDPAGLRLAEGRVDFDQVAARKGALLEKAAARFLDRGGESLGSAFEIFCREQRAWLDDFALFAALRRAHGGAVWTQWEPEIAARSPEAMKRWAGRLAGAADQQRVLQFLFFRQWGALRRRASAGGIRILGDVPMFVAHDSADVWSRRELFRLNGRGEPEVVAGVPPDAFSDKGQIWGTPLYRWDEMGRAGFSWWIDRLRMALLQADLVRIDHFIGFTRCWEVPADSDTAVVGRWVPSPGDAILRALADALGGLAIVAEDLGLVIPEVTDLRDRFGLPGMRVLQFAFADGATNPHLPHNFVPHSVVYTSTHDNDTTVGWFRSAPEHVRRFARRYLGSDGVDIALDLMRLALVSVADTAIIPAQDALALGSEARMNVPGRAAGNWSWRLRPDELGPAHAGTLRELAELSGR